MIHGPCELDRCRILLTAVYEALAAKRLTEGFTMRQPSLRIVPHLASRTLPRLIAIQHQPIGDVVLIDVVTYCTVSRPTRSETTRSTLPNHLLGLRPRRAVSARSCRRRLGPAFYDASVISPLLSSSIGSSL